MPLAFEAFPHVFHLFLLRSLSYNCTGFLPSSSLVSIGLNHDTSNKTGGDSAAVSLVFVQKPGGHVSLPSTLTKVETLSDLNGHGMKNLALHLDVVTGHDHLAGRILGTLNEVQGSRNIRSTQEHLGAVVSVETGVATTLLLSEDVHGDKELGVGLGGANLGHNHTTLDLLALDTTEENSTVVTSLGLVEVLLEGLDSGNDGLEGFLVEANELDLVTLFEDTTLDTSSSNGTTASNGENICGASENDAA